MPRSSDVGGSTTVTNCSHDWKHPVTRLGHADQRAIRAVGALSWFVSPNEERANDRSRAPPAQYAVRAPTSGRDRSAQAGSRSVRTALSGVDRVWEQRRPRTAAAPVCKTSAGGSEGLPPLVRFRRSGGIRQAHAGRGPQPGSGRGHRDHRFSLLGLARPDAALLDACARVDAGQLRGGFGIRRLLDSRLPGDPGIRHVAGSGSRHRSHRPLPPAQDAQPELLRTGSGNRGVLLPRPQVHRQEGRGLPGVHRGGRYRLLRAGSRILYLQRHPLRSELTRGLLPDRFGGRDLELGSRRGPEPRLQASPQGGLFSGTANGSFPGSALGDDPEDGGAGYRDRDPAP